MIRYPLETVDQGTQIYTVGQPLEQANAAMILLHGRGASAGDILGLSDSLKYPNFAYLAPQAANASWYPYRFLAPIERNEPWLSSALGMIAELVDSVEAAGIPAEKLILAGFSQGACLAAEFVARHPSRYGGLLVFSGGLIGPPKTQFNYAGSLEGTPVFVGCGDRDPHIPVSRVEETAAELRKLGAEVTAKIYPAMGHTIVEDELAEARHIISNLKI
jgi:predicted esterase